MNRKMSLHHFESQSLWVLSCSLTPHNDDTKPVDNFRERHSRPISEDYKNKHATYNNLYHDCVKGVLGCLTISPAAVWHLKLFLSG